MDDENLHINQMKKQNYPEPDVPVAEAWEGMKELLINDPGNMSSSGMEKSLFSKIFIYAAAVLIISAMLVYYLVANKSKNQVVTKTIYSQNQPQKDTLSDGSIAFLDRHSSINQRIDTGNQKLIAITGAIYFEESKSNNKQVNHLQIGSLDVVPEKANIYVSHDSILGLSSVQVQSGSALITIKGERLTLTAGESVVYDERAGQLKNKQQADVNLYSYATKIFEFNNTSLKDVAVALEKAYGVQIIFENKKLYACRITTRFDNKSLKEVLDILSYTLNFEYLNDEKNNQVLLIGNGCK